MSRLLVLCEGHAEAEFVKVVLRWHLADIGYHSVAARLFGYHHSRARRGGIVRWPQARRDIVRHLKQDPGVVVTTMVDHYGLPSASPNGWPGRRRSESEPDVSHDTPEETDDDPQGSPSKRIQGVIPSYRKRSMGSQAARAIGIPAMTRACPHFASWIERLSGRIRSG